MYDGRRTILGAVMSDTGLQSGAPLRTAGQPERGELELAAVLHALSDPVRLQIVGGLSDGAERACGSFGLPVTKSTCTHHFRVLREAGVIHQREDGNRRWTTLRAADLERRFPGLVDTVMSAYEKPGT